MVMESVHTFGFNIINFVQDQFVFMFCKKASPNLNKILI